MANYPNVEEQLLEQQEREFEAQQQQERLLQQQNGTLGAAQSIAKDYGKNLVKNVAKEQAVAAASTVGSAIVASVWGPILGILLLVFGLVTFSLVAMIGVCNQGGAKGFFIKSASYVASYLPGISEDICAALAINTTAPNLPQVTTPPTGNPSDLVSLIGVVPVSPSASDPRVAQCMLRRVQDLYNASVASGLNWTVTSAYRPGATTATRLESAHSRGEAIDIALIPTPTKPLSTNTQIIQLVELAKAQGFRPPAGDTLDEYNRPNEKTTGGHIHIEFNINSQTNSSYCLTGTNA
jgi:hypothetical protein